jgi:hypothetical protein
VLRNTTERVAETTSRISFNSVLVLVIEKLSYVKPVAKQIEDEYEDEDDEKVAISKRI